MKTNDKHAAVSRIAGRGLVLVGLLAMVLSTTITSRAQSSVAAPASAAKAPAAVATPAAAPARTSPEAAVKPPAKGQHEGIAVHGHWTIVVKNPDGKVVSRQEFENALDPIEGADLLTGMLSGEYAAGGFAIDLYAANGGICGGSADCTLFDSRVAAGCGPSQAAAGFCSTLTYSPNLGTTFPNAIGFTLGGSITMQPSDAGTITDVTSGIYACYDGAYVQGPNTATEYGGTTNLTKVTDAAAITSLALNTLAPGNSPFFSGGCNGEGILALTSKSISQTVSGGQTVTVSVAITFGSGS